jgi:tRNA(Ile)-lysidine synthase
MSGVLELPERSSLTVEGVLDARLVKCASAPLALALSGGGDSLALLILTLAWARRHGREVHALVFDHALHPDSGGWTQFALAAARRLGARAEALRWDGPKPTVGVPAAARAARHAALADRARTLGAGVLLMGHTADDRLESALMRQAGTSVSDPAEWAPSPAWPQGRGLFILRPLLDVRRAELRALLRERGETWLDDPANENLKFARARARQALSPDQAASKLRPRASASIDGWREAFGALVAHGPVDPASIAPAILSVGGGLRPPARERLARLAVQVAQPGDFSATLAHARLQRRGEVLTISREAGRAPPKSDSLRPGAVQVWDGRFEISSSAAACLRPLAGLAARLPAAQRAALRGVPACARPALPALVDAAGAVVCPILSDAPEGTAAVSLVMARFAAACGQTAAEPI